MTCHFIALSSRLLRKVKWGKKTQQNARVSCTVLCNYNAVYIETLCCTETERRLPRAAVESFWVTSLKSLLPSTDLLLTFNRVRIPYITVFSLFASAVASDTLYPNLDCYFSPFVILLPRCVQTSHRDLHFALSGCVIEQKSGFWCKKEMRAGIFFLYPFKSLFSVKNLTERQKPSLWFLWYWSCEE